MDCSSSRSSSHGIFQAGILEWIAVSFSRGPSWPKDWTPVCIAGRLFTIRHQEIPKYLTYIFSFQKSFIKFDCRNDPYRTFQVAQCIKNLPAMRETQEARVQSLSREDPLQEENGNPFQYSCLKIPWTEEPGRLQSKASQRVRHDCVTEHHVSTPWWCVCCAMLSCVQLCDPIRANTLLESLLSVSLFFFETIILKLLLSSLKSS